jgi:hypothetical protein
MEEPAAARGFKESVYRSDWHKMNYMVLYYYAGI